MSREELPHGSRPGREEVCSLSISVKSAEDSGSRLPRADFAVLNPEQGQETPHRLRAETMVQPWKPSQADQLGEGRGKHRTSAEHNGAEGHAHVPPVPEHWESPNPTPWGAADPGRTARCGCCPAFPGPVSGTSAAAAGSPAAGEKHKPAESGGPGRAGLTPAPQGCHLWQQHLPCHGFKGTARLLILSLKGPWYSTGLPLTWGLHRGPWMCRHLCQGRVNGTGEGTASAPHILLCLAQLYHIPAGVRFIPLLLQPSQELQAKCRVKGMGDLTPAPQTEPPPSPPSPQLTITLQDFPLRSLPSPGR